MYDLISGNNRKGSQIKSKTKKNILELKQQQPGNTTFEVKHIN